MLTAPTLDQLQQLKLDAMAHAWTEQQQHAELTSLGFDERFGLLVDAEWLARDNKRVTRALKEAKLKFPHACVEAIDYPARRELDKAVIRQLATCRWVQEHHNVILVGATGTGKSFVACALAAHACRKGFRAYYRRAPRLFHDLTLARADGTYIRLLGKLARVDVLLIDDWGLAPVTDQERRDLLEILEDRYGDRSTIITSQLPPGAAMILVLGLWTFLRALLGRSTAVTLENVALRHQLDVLRRSTPRFRLRRRDRVFWVCLSRLWANWRASLVLVRPATVIAWHRQGFRLYWRWKSRPRLPARPPIDPEIRRLIRG
jgi:DNA replication protein DnaC